ncbi:cold shock domain-containing protein [Photobacterium lipolyticum]|uniref:Cold-shock protein n=1 Tax=Photobacterium lipolyticum TaxID=266810 RepID=A0A2T3MQS3_9GAMM|nr:cold shock domain-containing protein [Photobacterium lipolyticum]PSV99582.1 cold-shock protein [Photobacterium lipolyticum]
MEGEIVRWNDERGFGFISSHGMKGDIFAHVSKFQKGYRRPKVGDLVEFQIELKDGKKRAHSIVIQGVEPLKETSNTISIILSGLFIIALVFAVYTFLIEPRFFPNVEGLGFSCQGKTHCSQMTSCDEARFYLAKCPDVQIDGDHDGVPCESQLCSW